MLLFPTAEADGDDGLKPRNEDLLRGFGRPKRESALIGDPLPCVLISELRLSHDPGRTLPASQPGFEPQTPTIPHSSRGEEGLDLGC